VWQEALEYVRDQQWVPSGIDYDRAIHHNPDAKAWADLFMQTFPHCGADPETMHGWFANSMMAMYDHLKNNQPAQQGSVPDVGSMAEVLGEWVRNTTGTALTHVTLVDMVRVMLATTAPQPGSDGNKRHWYALSYRGRDRESGYTADAVTYTGYPENALTLARIQAAKADAGVDDKAVLVCATYLGHMTKEEFTAQPPREGEGDE
jgi:hypothetical protein